MDRIKKNFGFGMMRLPMKGDQIDFDQTSAMVDVFLQDGFNYFDTAHGYLDEQSEVAVRKCLTDRYPREDYVLTNKLTGMYFKKQEDIRPLFQKQLEICGVDYFDFYLMHAQVANNYPHFRECRAYETAFELKEEGKVRHVGLSFHDTPELLEQILADYPQVEVVQIQLNYLDYDDPAVQSGELYEICKRHGKPVIVMEPVKGGHLADVPEAAREILDGLHGGSPAGYAIRYAAGFEDVFMVISGMSSLEQMEENAGVMRDFRPLDQEESEAVEKVREIIRAEDLIPCTACRYCVAGCPQGIDIPELFSLMNKKQLYHDWNADYYYHQVHTSEGRKASDCVKCGRCEKACPQHLPIRSLLEEVAEEFETGEVETGD
ncbi:MAG: aldo/keto reductase [Oscillospiraceae bacterium]|nr:aldo/keto reductase [Oscillospiraceae bacterium]